MNKFDLKKIKDILPLLAVGIYLMLSFKGSILFFIFIAVGLFFILKFAKYGKKPNDVVKEFFQKFYNPNFLNNKQNNKYNDSVVREAEIVEDESLKIIMEKGKIFKWVGLLVLMLWFFWSLIVIVGAGETGVVSLFGKVRNDELRSGFHLVNPLANVTKMTIRTEEYTMSKATSEGKKTGDDSITALTKEGLNITLDVTVFYHIEENKASDIYKEVGPTYEEKIIRPEIRGVIRDMVAQYDSKDIYSEKRNELGINILNNLKNKIGPRGIVAEDLLIRDVSLPANITQAIQEKLKAEQEAQRYDFVLATEKKEAERKVIEAEGQRDAQKIIDESLSEEYLNYLYIKELKDRQGTIYVPVSPSTGMPMFKGIE